MPSAQLPLSQARYQEMTFEYDTGWAGIFLVCVGFNSISSARNRICFSFHLNFRLLFHLPLG